jgi:pilus assembly protein Flp/PilA
MKWSYFIRNRSDEKGQGLIEYALILVLVTIVVIAILLLLGPQIGNVFSNVVTNLRNTGNAGGGQTITFNGTPSVSKSGSTSCTYSASVPVEVMQGGQPASSVAVNGMVYVLNNGGYTISSFSINGTTNANGQATLTGTKSSAPCAGAKAQVSISGGPSTEVNVP